MPELIIDVPARLAYLRGKPLDLSTEEYALLRTLAAHPTHVFSKTELIHAIWGQRAVGRSPRMLDSHACRLRHKLGFGGRRFIVNIWMVGYRLVDDPSDVVLVRLKD